MWWSFTKNEWGRLWERWCLLSDTKRWWWRWLRWTHFFDDEGLEELAHYILEKNPILKIQNLRLGVVQVVVEGSEPGCFECRFEHHQVLVVE